VVVVLAMGACGDNIKVAETADAAGVDGSPLQSPIERGRYIMNTLGACTFCHTPLNPDGSRNMNKLFSGVDCLFDTDTDPTNGMGCISSRNLTPDATGLKNATDDQIKNAFRNGHRTDGKNLAPVMPYWIFHNMTDDDADAVVAYLRSIPPVNHTVMANEVPWSLYNDGTLPMSPYIQDTEIPVGRFGGTHSDRGRYLAAKSGLCIDCHTPAETNPMSPRLIDLTQAFQGGRMFTKEQLGLLDPSYPAMIYSRNITPDPTNGLGGWTTQQIEDAISKGKDRMGDAVCAATHGSGISPYAALTQQDLDDITTYIESIPPVSNAAGSDSCQGPPVP
jgi:mono/diheme cytochrome c family protein